MTKKDFELIARVLRDERDEWRDSHARQIIEVVALRFARELSELYPRFDRPRFLAAVGVEKP